MRVIECSMCRRRAAWLIDGNSSARDIRKSSSRKRVSIALGFDGLRKQRVHSATEGAFSGLPPEKRKRESRCPTSLPFTLNR